VSGTYKLVAVENADTVLDVEIKGHSLFAIREMSPRSNIREVKASVVNQSRGSISSEQQRLCFGDNELEDDDLSLMDIPHFKHGVTFECVLQPVPVDDSSQMDLDSPNRPARVSHSQDPIQEAMNRMTLR